jgi:hypothetical protein
VLAWERDKVDLEFSFQRIWLLAPLGARVFGFFLALLAPLSEVSSFSKLGKLKFAFDVCFRAFIKLLTQFSVKTFRVLDRGCLELLGPWGLSTFWFAKLVRSDSLWRITITRLFLLWVVRFGEDFYTGAYLRCIVWRDVQKPSWFPQDVVIEETWNRGIWSTKYLLGLSISQLKDIKTISEERLTIAIKLLKELGWAGLSERQQTFVLSVREDCIRLNAIASQKVRRKWTFGKKTGPIAPPARLEYWALAKDQILDREIWFLGTWYPMPAFYPGYVGHFLTSV